jgi:2,3-dihydroxybenzoate decarboxylase
MPFTMTTAKVRLPGKVALEEAFNLPRLEAFTQANIGLYVSPEREAEYSSGIVNIEDRVKEARKTGVGYTICSLTVPGPQGERNVQAAEALARESNDWIAKEIGKFPGELGAFAAVSMHNPTQAAQELRRCIKEYGFHGVMFNNWQHAYDASGKETVLLFDGPEYDIFWATVQELDVPVYMHPNKPEGPLYEMLFKDRPYLQGPPQSFGIDVSQHVMGLISNGVFDRFPGVQLILGHMGERLPFDFDRINRWFEKVEKPRGMELKCKKTIQEYFRQNIWLTTSGQFSTIVLQFCMSLVGADRILYSVDYPYELYTDAADWFDNAEINTTDKVKIGRENARKLMKLPEYKDFDAPFTQ